MKNDERQAVAEDAIAVVGMAGRFPGGETLETFWDLLRRGGEGVTFFTEDELLENSVAPEVFRRPGYVKAKPVLERIEEFDAAFFHISPREAELMDPQHRLFLECSWEAIESSAHDPWTHPGRIGVFASAGKNTYLLFNLLSQKDWAQDQEVFQLLLGNEKDYLASRVSYKLNLKGPSVTLQTACSSSLVAVHMACQSLLLGECDMALAGGVSVDPPQVAGHCYRSGGVLSPDGHCRAFDARAEGVTFGQGVGVVVLRKAADALEAGDHVQALVRGTAVNNDGADRMGFSAPSPRGQAAAIREAIAVSGVSPETITYVEAHGTATPIGDPIELQALTEAFREHTAREQYCAIGSVKTNIGHLGAAAGIAGMIKTILALRHGELPASLHFSEPNPRIPLAGSPFFVNTRLREWTSDGPRRAGISSFGQGGTNAHVILEEAPRVTGSPASRADQLLLISAETVAALQQASERLAAFLERTDFELADVAYSLQVGRRDLTFRRAVVCRSRQEAVTALRTLDHRHVVQYQGTLSGAGVELVFADVGREELRVPSALEDTEPEFRRAFEECRRLEAGALGDPAGSLPEHDFHVMVFAVQYALARLWRSWGIVPRRARGEGAGALVARVLDGGLGLAEGLAAAREGQWPEDEVPPTRAEGTVRLVLAPRRPISHAHGGLAPAQGDSVDGGADMTQAIAQLWLLGVSCDWEAYHSGERRLRLPLPTYPFQRRRFWIETSRAPVAGDRLERRRRSDAPVAVVERPRLRSRAEVEAAVLQIFGKALGLTELGPREDFFDCGGDSLAELQVRSDLEERLGAQLPPGVLYERPTAAELAQLLLESDDGGARSCPADVADVAADIVLDPSISGNGRGLPATAAPEHILVTGATGLLGSHVVAELLARTDAQIHCLVRAATVGEAARRLHDKAASYHIGRYVVPERIEPVLGDLAEHRLGLSKRDFSSLANSVDAVYHCGAQVNFLKSYSSLKRVNVDATHEVLSFAATGRSKAVHHMSSIAVFESETFARAPRVTEDQDLSASQGFTNGYDLTKWVSERMISLAWRRSLPVSIYRLSNIVGHSEIGILSPRHIVAALVKGCIQLGLAPGEDKVINLLPVDAASRIVVALSLLPSALRGTFHVVNPRSTRIRDVIDWLVARGYVLKSCSYQDWHEALRNAPNANPFKLYLPLLDEAPLFSNRTYDMARVRACMPDVERLCPVFDQVLLDRLLTQMIAAGDLEQPVAKSTATALAHCAQAAE